MIPWARCCLPGTLNPFFKVVYPSSRCEECLKLPVKEPMVVGPLLLYSLPENCILDEGVLEPYLSLFLILFLFQRFCEQLINYIKDL